MVESIIIDECMDLGLKAVKFTEEWSVTARKAHTILQGDSLETKRSSCGGVVEHAGMPISASLSPFE